MDFLASPYVLITDRESTLIRREWHDVPIVMQTDPDQEFKDETESVVEACETIASTPNEEVEQKLKELLERTKEKYAREPAFQPAFHPFPSTTREEQKINEAPPAVHSTPPIKPPTPHVTTQPVIQPIKPETPKECDEKHHAPNEMRHEETTNQEKRQTHDEQETTKENEQSGEEISKEEETSEAEEGDEGEEEYVSLADLEKHPYCHTKDIELNYTILLLALNEMSQKPPEEDKLPPLIEDVDDEPVQTQKVVAKTSCRKWSIAIVFVWLLVSYQLLTRFSELPIS